MSVILRHLEQCRRLGIVNAQGTFVKMYKSYFCWAQLVLRIQTSAVIGFLFCISVSANAATWYVDNTATGANNGTSWANAWTSLSSASGSSVSAGDTIYISGGPGGSSQTYNLSSSWTPKSGTSGNRITYQIGQDSLHNGTAYFSGSGSWLSGPILNVTISGDAGDGQMHFTIANPSNNTSPWTTLMSDAGSYQVLNFRLSYVNCGMISGDTHIIYIYSNNSSGVEMDHLWMMGTGNIDICIYPIGWPGTGVGYSQGFFLHDTTVYAPNVNGTSGIGADCVQTGASGLTISNCTFIGYINGNGQNHQDGLQDLGSDYAIVCNNTIIGMADIGIYLGEYSAGFNHVRIYNNLVVNCQVSGIAVTSDSATYPCSDVVVANNVVEATGVFGDASIQMNRAIISYSNCLAANNITMGYATTTTTGVTNTDNVLLTGAQAAAAFVSYVANATNNNYHLLATATSLIGTGANLSSYFTTDKGGNPRPATGNWDMGAYEYNSSGGGSTNPAILVSPSSLDFGIALTNTSINLTLAVQNTGGGTLTGSASVVAPFQIVSGGTYSLGSNQAQTVTVGFNPTVASTFNQTITFTGANGASASAAGLAYVIQPGLSFNSTNGTILSPFTVASGYISQAVTTGLSGSGEAVYGFSVSNAGSYVISALVNAPSTAANSFYVKIDGQPTDPTMIWDPPVTTGFTNLLVSWRGTGTDTNNQYVPEVFSLSAGAHQLIVRGRESGAQLAAITILPYSVPAAPTGLHVISP